MSRPLRIEYEGAVYHVTSRGNARGDIYLSDDDRELFLDVLSHVVDRFKWVCHAYCLMGNHYHLMIETPQGNLSRGMRQLNGIYTQRFNRKHGQVGHVFQGRFKSILVDKDAYLLELSRYIVRNPVAAGMVEHVGDWPWSSYRVTAGLEPSFLFLERDWLLSQFGASRQKAEAAYKSFVCKEEDIVSPWSQLNGPDILGDDVFRSQLQVEVDKFPEEVPRSKRALRHLPLAEIADERDRSDWMHEAYTEHGYTMQEIATYAGLHHSTISKYIKMKDINPRIKT